MAIPDAQKTATVAEQKALGVKLDSVVAGVGGQAEGATHGDGDTGVMVLGVRQDVAAALAADGKYIPFSLDEDGNLRVVGSFASVSNVEYAEDTAHITADKGNLVLGVRKDAAAALADADGKYIPFIVDDNGQLYVALPGTTEADIAAIKAAIEGTLTVQATDLDVRPLVNTDVVTVEQATHDSLNLNANTQIGDADSAAGAGNSGATVQRVTIATDDINLAAIKAAIEAALTVQATDLDIRPLVNTDVVTVEQATHDSLNLNANTQIGDADSAAGAGNSGVTVQRVTIATDDVNLAAIKAAIEAALTVTATDLDIRNLAAATDSVDANMQVGDADADYQNPVPTEETIDGWVSWGKTLNSASDTPMESAPGAGSALIIKDLQIQQGAATPTAQTVAVKIGGAIRGYIRLSDNDGAGASLKIIYGADNANFSLDSDQAQLCTVSYSVKTVTL
jgi:hypothetical protein